MKGCWRGKELKKKMKTRWKKRRIGIESEKKADVMRYVILTQIMAFLIRSLNARRKIIRFNEIFARKCWNSGEEKFFVQLFPQRFSVFVFLFSTNWRFSNLLHRKYRRANREGIPSDEELMKKMVLKNQI